MLNLLYAMVAILVSSLPTPAVAAKCDAAQLKQQALSCMEQGRSPDQCAAEMGANAANSECGGDNDKKITGAKGDKKKSVKRPAATAPAQPAAPKPQMSEACRKLLSEAIDAPYIHGYVLFESECGKESSKLKSAAHRELPQRKYSAKSQEYLEKAFNSKTSLDAMEAIVEGRRQEAYFDPAEVQSFLGAVANVASTMYGIQSARLRSSASGTSGSPTAGRPSPLPTAQKGPSSDISGTNR